MKKNYSNFQRITNIINRAIEEFGMEYDMQDTLDELYDRACNVISDNIGYDRIEECEMSNHHSHLTWNDGMGFYLEADGEFISGSAQRNIWRRKQADGSFVKIDWFKADSENDYVECYNAFDSEGQFVLLVCK